MKNKTLEKLLDETQIRIASVDYMTLVSLLEKLRSEVEQLEIANEELSRRDRFLSLLQDYGVDSWEGYERAREESAS